MKQESEKTNIVTPTVDPNSDAKEFVNLVQDPFSIQGSKCRGCGSSCGKCGKCGGNCQGSCSGCRKCRAVSVSEKSSSSQTVKK